MSLTPEQNRDKIELIEGEIEYFLAGKYCTEPEHCAACCGQTGFVASSMEELVMYQALAAAEQAISLYRKLQP